jgi:hypothetical protein
MKEQWEVAYDEWALLLDRANAKGLLKDPKAVWDEAWRQAAMVTIGILEVNPESTSEQLTQFIEKRLLK